MPALPTPTLPNDANELRLLVLRREAELIEQKLLVHKLRLEVALLKRQKYGTSSERLRELGQLQLLVEEFEAEQETLERKRVATGERKEPCSDEGNEPAGSGRKPLPDHLPREQVRHEPKEHEHCTCEGCDGKLRYLGEDASDMLEIVPARFKVIRHVRPKYACNKCDAIVQTPAASRPIERGIAGAGLLAHILVSKYADHLPLYRQSEIYARDGVDLSRSTLAGMVGGCAALLDPLVDAIRRHVLAAQKLHGDDTPLPVLAPGTGKTKTGRLWVYVRDDRPAAGQDAPAVWFEYAPDRKGERPQTHLREFRGILQADGYAGFDALYESGRVVEAACWTHARRKYFELHAATGSPQAKLAVQRIGELYAIEETIRGKPPDERERVRQLQAAPKLAALWQWMHETLSAVSPRSALAKAIMYSAKRWTALTRYAQDGRIEIDNSAAERGLRCVALGRNNFLFAGSDAGGERAAAMYSLMGTAKLNGIDPQAYLRHVLERIGEHPINKVDELLPWNVAPMLAAESEDIRLAA